jgi:hypothetical protein
VSARLIGELTEWLRTPAAEGLTPAERCVLFAIAERCHESTRRMLRHRRDDEQLVERLASVTGLDREGALRRALRSLARRGLEVRVPARAGKDGRPVFAFEGHSMEFRLPVFPASVELPRGGTETHPSAPVDNDPDPVDNSPPGGAVGPPEAVRKRTPLEAEAVRKRTPLAPRGGTETHPLSPSKNIPPKEHPSLVRSLLAEEEGCTREPEKTIKNREFEFDFRSACAYLLQAPPAVQTAAMARAAEELPDATNEDLRIRAAEIAAKGIPA